MTKGKDKWAWFNPIMSKYKLELLPSYALSLYKIMNGTFFSLRTKSLFDSVI
jgi:hypothetical protein